MSWGMIGSATIGAYSSYKKGKDAKDAANASKEQIQKAIDSIRSPLEILKEAYGKDGMYGPEMMDQIMAVENALMGPMTDLLKNYGTSVAFGEDGLDEISKRTTEDILSRINELGPEFREALQDPTIKGLLDDQIAKFKGDLAASEGRAEDREAAAKLFDEGISAALEKGGVSLDAIQQAKVDSAAPFIEGLQNFDTSDLKNFDLSNLKNLSTDALRNIDVSKSTGFLDDIRGLTDTSLSEADRLTKLAQGPLDFEALRGAQQAAATQSGGLGRLDDASALMRAALGRTEAVQGREDRAAQARKDAFSMAGAGSTAAMNQEKMLADIEKAASNLDLSREGLISKLGIGALQSGLGMDLSALGAGATAGLNLDKLNLMKGELGANTAMNFGKLNALLGAQAREEAMSERKEGRAGFRDVFDAATSASIDPSGIFFAEAKPALDLYAQIMGQTPGTIFTDPGEALNVGSQYDANLANIYAGQGEASAANAAIFGEQASKGYGKVAETIGDFDFGDFMDSGGFTGNKDTNIFSATKDFFGGLFD